MGNFKELFKDFCGWALIGLGILGLFLPILQGILMILAGIAILERNKEKKTLDKIKKYLKRKLKK
ncbi:MAG: hypothetical protein KJ601_00160 [Nanoarchaeota archaeon]|nr:hypothetical protein [Nanoarchaeota archaeon]